MGFERSRITILVGILTGACLLVAAAVCVILYITFVDGQKARLVDAVRAQASLMSAIARQAKLDSPPGSDWRRYALIQVVSGQADFPGFGKTGEFTLAAREGDAIVFYLSHRHLDMDNPLPVPWESSSSSPMRAALLGESGVGLGLDYRGVQVLAAYQPLPEFGMGLVAKIDMDEVEHPFAIAWKAAGVLALLVVAAGALMFHRVTHPVLRRLSLSEQRYRDLVEHMRGGVTVMKAIKLGRDFQVIEVNAGAERIDGLARLEIVGLSFTSIFPGAVEYGLLDAARRVYATGTPEHLPMAFYQDDRISGWRDHSFYRLPSGEVVHIYDDVTDRKRAEAGLQMAAAVFQHTGEGIVVTDELGRIQRINPAFSAITGYAAEEVVGRSPALLKSDRQAPDFYKTMWQTLTASGRWQGEIWNRRKNGEAYLEWLTINAVRNEHGEVAHYVGVFDDISELHEKEQRIRHQAYHDALTGLANRTLLTDRLEHAIATADRGELKVAVMFLDLDRFKVVNDSLGHDVGDELLKAVAHRLKGSLRRADTVARLGGDEFVILCTHWDNPGEIAQLGDKVLDLLKEPFAISGHDLHVGCSIGISLFPADGEDARTLLKNADTAMYTVKEGGRDGYRFFDASMNAQAVERLTLENALRQAVERQEFEVYYQPKIYLHTGRVAGMEALVRWHHPTQGMISPVRFIPLAEETGLVIAMGEWVLRQSCRQVRLWAEAGVNPGPVAVNVSARQLGLADFAARVAAILEEEGVAPGAIDLEITETAIMSDPDRAAAQLEQLADMGVRIALDDFGVGYSSLGYLKRLPISVLKMDRSFIQDVIENEDSAQLARGIVRLAMALDIDVVAEGVETIEQVEFLRACGCGMVQGYYYSRPLPPAKLDEEFLHGGVREYQ
ncbi:MAG: EAL domain-containing protein [Rhodospirillaceae bacterium]|nr:EAL domain-containing protein [Rhodospirillales bacterium]